MPRSDEAEWWFSAVYAAVQEIPRSRITTYGHIAKLLGKPTLTHAAQCPRQVGICLKYLPDWKATDPPFYNIRNVPWQRVVNAKGGISPRGPGSVMRHATALRREGVRVDAGALCEMSVDLSEYGWFPERLPSESVEAESEDGSDDEDVDQQGRNGDTS